jgi:hypothetical protein
MPRYVFQDHDDTCGPIAIINAGKWIDNSLSKKRHYHKLIDEVMNKRPIGDNYRGSNRRKFEKTIKKIFKDKVKIVKQKHNCLSNVYEHLKNKGSAIIGFDFFDAEGNGSHVAFFSGVDENNCFIGHNIWSNEPTTHIPPEEMIDYFYHQFSYPEVFLITRK